MGQLLEDLQYKLKTSSSSLALFSFRLVTGLFLGLTFALIFQEVIKYQSLAFTFVLVAVTGAILRLSKSWNFVGVVVFNLICVLIGLLLHMYIIMAPGA